jgi:PQQ-dependent dehydrogenase (methanol/ethanol family)
MSDIFTLLRTDRRSPANGSLTTEMTGGNRYSPLKQISTANVSSLKLKWVFPIQHFGLETTPLAADGVLYVTGPNQVFALDALTGSSIWHYSRPASIGMLGDAKLGTNRGVAILRDKVFFLTDNARLLALSRASGNLLWETPLADEPQHYGGTMAPLVVNNMVVVGVSGGDQGIRGFVAAFRADTGALVWRHWTVPRRGEPGIETWRGSEPLAGGGSTWLTGSYDPSSDTLYWSTGNPYPDGDDHDRPGDNPYTNCLLALNAKTGDLKWHYQFTPHDLMDRDATEPNVLVDTVYRGKPQNYRFTQIAMASSMCLIARTVNCCWPSPSCTASTGLRALEPTVARL